DISGCELPHNDLGINQSAVALLESVFLNHTPDEKHGFYPYPLFFHGCAINGTCGNRIIDFRVRHISHDNVLLDHFIVTGINNWNKYYRNKLVIPNMEYAQQILEFAQDSLKFLRSERGVGWEASAYSALKKDHEELFSLANDYIRTGKISASTRKKVKSLHQQRVGKRVNIILRFRVAAFNFKQLLCRRFHKQIHIEM
ncbi:MAG: hypothetical protein JW856_05780, partial [Dehalococcoidales bacterium]|nr:hypothetical protein [Dehalococcoidales bacterium]